MNDMKKNNDVKLCSSCGLCMTDTWSAEEGSQSCVFKTGWLGQKEIDLFGRERSIDDLDEASLVSHGKDLWLALTILFPVLPGAGL